MTEQHAKSVARRLTASIIAVILLTAALSVTTFILVSTTLATEGAGLFRTGDVRLNLNDGKPVIADSDCLFAPGTEVERQFTVENTGSCAVWYKLYFREISSAMAQQIEVEIRDGSGILAHGRMSEMTEENTQALDTALAVGEKRTLTLVFRLDENAGNDAQGQLLRFDFSARAVQCRNNPDKKFD